MNQNRRNTIFILIGILVVAAFLLKPSPDTMVDIADNAIPEDSPDVYITGLDLTRYNSEGHVIMTTKAQSMSVYNDTGESRLTRPNVTLVENNVDVWRISANSAVIFDNEDVEFSNNVIAVQTTSTPPLIVATESIKVKQGGTRISSDKPVQILQGKQAIDAIGMEVELGTIKPIIHLLSDVSFSYDPS